MKKIILLSAAIRRDGLCLSFFDSRATKRSQRKGRCAMRRFKQVVCCAATIVWALMVSPLRADTAFFDLGSDDAPYFTTYNSGGLWTIQPSSGGVQISKGVDDGTVNPYIGGIYGNLVSNFQVVGDFTATVNFIIYQLPLSDAPNSLSELSFFAVQQPSSQFLEILRFADDTSTNGLGSWSAPPGNWAYIGSSSLTAGVFELQRCGEVMTASIAPLAQTLLRR